MSILSKQKQLGFTIIELLIVIVVLGILATITYVAYNGVQAKAENTKTVSAVSQYAKALHMYSIANGSYPVTYYPCLGDASTVCANVTDTTGACNGAVSTTGNNTFETAIETIITPLPELSDQEIECDGKMYSGGFYYSMDGKTAYMVYYLKDDTVCTAPGSTMLATVYQDADKSATACYLTLPTL